MIYYNIQHSGSLDVSGSFTINGNDLSNGSVSSSYATTSISSSYATTSISSSIAVVTERVQAGTSGSRDLTTPQSGSLWFNTNTTNLEVYTGTSGSLWKVVGAQTESSVVSSYPFDFFGDNSAVLFYKLDGNVDDEGVTYNTTATNVSYSTGKFGSGVNMVADLTAVSNTNILPSGLDGITWPFADNATALSISMWIKRNNTSDPVFVNGGYYNGGQRGFFITVTGTSTTPLQGDGISQSANSFRVYNAGNTNSDIVVQASYNASNFPIDTWTHFAFVFDGSQTNCKMYIDGSLETTVSNAAWTKIPNISGNTSPSNTIVWGGVGYTNVCGGQSFDHIRVFSKVLTLSEVQSLANES